VHEVGRTVPGGACVTRELPTDPGTVIGWTTYYDGIHYSTAVLDWGDADVEIMWWRAGFDEPLPAPDLLNILGDHWQVVGKVNLCPFVHPEHCGDHANHVTA
jgi:hypothetical protein